MDQQPVALLLIEGSEDKGARQGRDRKNSQTPAAKPCEDMRWPQTELYRAGSTEKQEPRLAQKQPFLCR